MTSLVLIITSEMTSLILIITYLGCVSSGAMLSMLMLLVGAYISAAIWFVCHNVIYAGLLYILVYVGAIVVLIMFVVQLTNTSLHQTSFSRNHFIENLPNLMLMLSLVVFLTQATYYYNDVMIHLSNFNFKNLSVTSEFVSSISNYFSCFTISLHLLASSIFNDYAYALILSVHAIVLAVIGPIKLAFNNNNL